MQHKGDHQQQQATAALGSALRCELPIWHQVANNLHSEHTCCISNSLPLTAADCLRQGGQRIIQHAHVAPAIRQGRPGQRLQDALERRQPAMSGDRKVPLCVPCRHASHRACRGSAAGWSSPQRTTPPAGVAAVLGRPAPPGWPGRCTPPPAHACSGPAHAPGDPVA